MFDVVKGAAALSTAFWSRALAKGKDDEVAEAFGVVPKCELSILLIPVADDRVLLSLDVALGSVDLRDFRDHRSGRRRLFHFEVFLDIAGVALVEDMV